MLHACDNVDVTLSFDAERKVERHSCPSCGSRYLQVKGFIHDDGNAHAIYFAACHDHGAREAWIDAILGTFDEDETEGRVTFGCRVGPVEGQTDPAATLIQAASPYSDVPLFGEKLSREEALAHDRLADFWTVVDFILVADPDVHAHVYGHPRNDGVAGRLRAMVRRA